MKTMRETLIAVFILGVAGLFLRSISHGEETPLHQSFADFPLHVASWAGEDQKLDTKVLRALKVDDYMLRQYWTEQGPPVGLYVGYYKSMRQGATYHSPKNCLPGSGWYFVETGKSQLRAADDRGHPVEVNKFIIQKGLEKQLVIYWYQDRGRIITSEYWAKIYMVVDAITKNRTDGAFVRITIPFKRGKEKEALRHGKDFANKLFPLLKEYLPS